MAKFNYKQYKHNDWHEKTREWHQEKEAERTIVAAEHYVETEQVAAQESVAQAVIDEMVAQHEESAPLQAIAMPARSAQQDALFEEVHASIKVLGVGGGGSNAVNSMVGSALEGVSFIIANTDAQSLKFSPAETRLQIGMKITKGLGAGSNPEIGRRAAEEDLDTIMEKISGTDILFLTAGLGGGTGTGAAPVIARAAREAGILTVGVVTKPFGFEGKRRQKQAADAIAQLREATDTLIVIPNQKLLEIADPKISMIDAFAMANNVLLQAIKGVADIIVRSGHINVDFADVRSIMKGMGMAIMGTGRASGENRAQKAAIAAINSPLVEDVRIEGAKGVLINITGSPALGLHEISEAAQVIYEKASEDANIILGSVIDATMGDEIMVTVIATGFDVMPLAAAQPVQTKAHTFAKAPFNIVEMQAKQEAAEVVEQEACEILAEAENKEEIGVAKRALEEVAAEKRNIVLKQSLDLNDLDTPTFMREKVQQEGSEQK